MTAYYNEFDPGAAEWLRELIKGGHIAPGVVDERSILDVQPRELAEFTQCHFFAGIGGWSLALRLAGWPDDRPVWTGSPPCQPFSVAGENKGQDDERHLAPKFISLVGACRPGVLFGEQVASAAVFGKVAKRTRNGTEIAPEWAWLDDLSDRLEGARYAVGAVDFPSAGVDAPHIRQRTYFGAVDTLRLAKSDSGECDRLTEHDGDDLYGAQGGWEQRNSEPAGDREAQRMANASSTPGRENPGSAFGNEAPDGRAGRDRRKQDRDNGSAGYGENSGVADATSPRSLPGAQPGIHRREESAGPRDGEPERCGASQWLADADGRNASAKREQSGGEYGLQQEGYFADRLGDSIGPRLEGQRRYGDNRDEPRRDDPQPNGPTAETGAAGRTDAPDSFWSDPDWLFCRDGKWRPVEPGTFPLAHGVPGRVGLLRGYGNAINPQQAAVFIEAFSNVT